MQSSISFGETRYGFFSKRFIVICNLALGFLLVSVMAPEAVAQKKKDKNNDSGNQAAQMDSAQYQMELLKSWSFGWENYKNKQYKEVARYFWKVIEMDTTGRFKRVYRYLGQTYFELGIPDSAQYAYELGIKAQPDDDSIRRNLAYLYAAREQHDKAIAEYEIIREQGAASEDDLSRLANLYLRTQENSKAIATYEEILKINPENEEARNTISQLYHMSGDVEKMIESMEQSLLQNPNDTQTLFSLARTRYDRQEYEKAIEALERYEKLNPTDLQALELKANAQMSVGRYNDAIATYKGIVEHNDKDKRNMVNIGTCYRELKQYSSARSWASRALAVDSDYGFARMLLGRAYESAADDCSAQKGKADFSDKLVYEKAYQQYGLAQKDPETRSDAKQRIQYLETSRPTNEDYFMNKSQKEPEGQCYSWLR